MSAALLVEIGVKTTLVLAAAWLATAVVLVRSSAAARHLVWASALFTALLMPALVSYGPAWRVQLPASWSSGASVGDVVQAAGDRGTTAAANPSAEPQAALRGPVIDPDDLFVAQDPVTAARAWGPRALVWVWLVGSLLGLLRLGAGLIWAAWIARRAHPLISADWREVVGQASAALGITRRVPVLITRRVTVPVALGLFRHRILVPEQAHQWDGQRRRVVLLHELAHVRRNDCLMQALSRLAAAVHWINPLVFLASWQLRVEQERAADDLVLTSGIDGPDYAQHLCAIAETARPLLFPEWATLAMARSSKFEQRIQAILDATRARRQPSWGLAAAALCAACLAVAPLAAIRMAAAEPAGALATVTISSGTATSLVGSPGPGRLGGVAATGVSHPSAAASALTTPAAQVSSTTQAAPVPDERRMLDQFCVSCHGGGVTAAAINLKIANVSNVGGDPEFWEKVVRKLRSGTHPPQSAAAPLDPINRDALVAALEVALDRGDASQWGPGAASALNDQEIAVHLARFLWGAAPDGQLTEAARRGRLRDPAGLDQQIRRMLADGRSSVMLNGFFGQWLYLRNLPSVRPDPALFPDFDEDLRTALQRETELFLASQVREDHSATELLTANYTFLNERLARHYGIANVSGSHFRRVVIGDDARAGLLGQGSILTVTSYANRTSPVLRGKFVVETFLGTTPPPPPPDVPALKPPVAGAETSGRRRLEESVRNPACASCHTGFDQLGFALENFNAIGQWRDVDGTLPVDASGTLAETKFNGPAQFRFALVQRSDAIVRTITERLLAYAVNGTYSGKSPYYDMPAVRAVVADAAAANYRWSTLISGIVRSRPFQMRRADRQP